MINKILCDTDFLVAFLIESEANHEKDNEVVEKYKKIEFLSTLISLNTS